MLAVADVADGLAPRLLDGELPVHLPPAGVVDQVDDPQQVQGLGDPPVLGERLAQRDRPPLAAEHPQQVVRADPPGHH